MEFSKKQIELLNEPILGKNVKERDGNHDGTFQIAYVEGHHVIAEANRIFGFGGWNSETIETTCIRAEPREVTYIARVRITIGDVIREGTGAGTSNQTNLSKNHENAIKEAETDARKRALMTFGNQFGLSLYNGKDKSWKTNKEKPQKQPSVSEIALKWIQKAATQEHLDEIKQRLNSSYNAGQINDSERHKLTNAIVQKEASLL